jgi:hypothetical protein
MLTLNSKEDNIDNHQPQVEDQPQRKREAKAIEPNQTIYIKNLNEKVKKEGGWLIHIWLWIRY